MSEREILGCLVRVDHDDDCDGWLLHEFVTSRLVEGEDDAPATKPGTPHPAYRPCHVCRPAQYLAWREGLLRRNGRAADKRRAEIAKQVAKGEIVVADGKRDGEIAVLEALAGTQVVLVENEPERSPDRWWDL